MNVANASPLAGFLSAGGSVLIALCAVGAGALLVLLLTSRAFGFDFHTFYRAAQAVTHHRDPYPPPTRAGVMHERAFVYPPLVAWAVVPLTLLSWQAAAVVFWTASVGALGLALWLMGVHDWRCYALVAAWAPVQIGLQYGTLNPFLVLGIAAAWRWRARLLVAASCLALVVAAKLFLAPLLLWPLLARRARTSVIAIITMVVAVFTPWALIGWRGLSSYRELLSALSVLQRPKSFTPGALATDVGGSAMEARVLTVATLVVVGAAFLRAWRRREEADVLSLLVTASLLLSPIVWMHYLTLLIIPAALRGPRLHVGWVAPLLLWPAVDLSTVGQSGGAAWRVVIVLAVIGFVCLRPKRAFRPLGRCATPRTLGW